MKAVNNIVLHIPEYFRGSCNGSHIRWKDHIGDIWNIEYNNVFYPIEVFSVIPNKNITFKHKDKTVSITHASMGNKLDEQNRKGYCNAGKLFYLISNTGTLGTTGYNSWIEYKYNVGDTLVYDNETLTILDRQLVENKWHYHNKQYKVRCAKCGGSFEMLESALDNHSKCYCCTNRIVIPGINDIATTHPWAIPYFKNKGDVYKYHAGSSFKVDFICPNCKRVHKNKVVSHFFRNTYHLDCSCRVGYKSYPERFIYNLFLQLGVKIHSQLTKSDFSWCSIWKYDFYHEQTKTIIEVNGVQHYNSGGINMWSNRDEHLNDQNKKQAALTQGIQNYIELDCRKSNKDWIKQAILNSELPNIFNFTEMDIDWERCDYESSSSLEYKICDMYNNNVDITVSDLGKQFGLKDNTIKLYLKRGSKLGLCNYDALSLREKINTHWIDSVHLAIRGTELVGVFSSIGDIMKHKENLGLDIIWDNQIRRSELTGEIIKGYIFKTVKNITKYSEVLCLVATTKSCDFIFN